MTIEERIQVCVDSFRPHLQADGGDLLVHRFRPDGVLEVQWTGTCAICPMSPLTLRAGVERAILHSIPEVKRVEAVAS